MTPRGTQRNAGGGRRENDRPQYARLRAVPADADVPDVERAPPGHRFTLYFNGWVEPINKEARKLGVKKWDLDPRSKEPILRKYCIAYGRETTNLLKKLLHRRRALCRQLEREFEPPIFCLTGVATSPFITGLGREHPLENGFAFLWPYGLPYLAGSGVKGVLRDAARELGLEGETIRWLFGPEPPRTRRGEAPKDAPRNRGALVFWDVLPVPPEGGSETPSMCVDVMTPHFLTYLKREGPPHESDNPKPIFFLTLPAGTRFDFVVEFRPPAGVPENIRASWKQDLERCFVAAFDFLGFGAKTALGYGAIQRSADSPGPPGGEATAKEPEPVEIPDALQQVLDELKETDKARVGHISNFELAKYEGSPGLRVLLARAILEAYDRLGCGPSAGSGLSKNQQRRIQRLQEIIDSGGRV